MNASSMQFRVYSRQGCHLCEDMIIALEPMIAGHPVTLDIVDLDDRPELIAEYGLRIPVLEADGEEVCSGHLDEARVRHLLADVT